MRREIPAHATFLAVSRPRRHLRAGNGGELYGRFCARAEGARSRLIDCSSGASPVRSQRQLNSLAPIAFQVPFASGSAKKWTFPTMARPFPGAAGPRPSFITGQAGSLNLDWPAIGVHPPIAHHWAHELPSTLASKTDAIIWLVGLRSDQTHGSFSTPPGVVTRRRDPNLGHARRGSLSFCPLVRR